MIYSSLERINVYHGKLSQVFGYVPETSEGFSDQGELDSFLQGNAIDPDSYLQVLQALGYANQAEVDAALVGGSLTRSIIYQAFIQL